MDDAARNVIGGRYEIITPLGKGGMGLVYKAHDPVLDRTVAVKKMAATLVDSVELRQRFYIEARAAARLNHPNIVTIYELEEHAGDIYIVMEMLDGVSLARFLQQRAPTPLAATLSILAQIAEGLHYAHLRAIVHRDIKPANLVLTTHGGVKILDFGIARLASTEITKTGAMLGTPHYMAPEQVHCQQVDARADLFSLGAVAYELVTGVTPFDADSIAALLMQITDVPHKPVLEVAPETSPELAALIDQLLAKDRAQRPASGMELCKLLERIGEIDRVDLIAEAVRATLGPAGDDTIYAPISPAPVASTVSPFAAAVGAGPKTPGDRDRRPGDSTQPGVPLPPDTLAGFAVTPSASAPPPPPPPPLPPVTLAASAVPAISPSPNPLDTSLNASLPPPDAASSVPPSVPPPVSPSAVLTPATAASGPGKVPPLPPPVPAAVSAPATAAQGPGDVPPLPSASSPASAASVSTDGTPRPVDIPPAPAPPSTVAAAPAPPTPTPSSPATAGATPLPTPTPASSMNPSASVGAGTPPVASGASVSATGTSAAARPYVNTGVPLPKTRSGSGAALVAIAAVLLLSFVGTGWWAYTTWRRLQTTTASTAGTQSQEPSTTPGASTTPATTTPTPPPTADASNPSNPSQAEDPATAATQPESQAAQENPAPSTPPASVDASASPSVAPSDTAATHTAANQSAATQPAATQPAATQPAAAQPAATQPSATQPSASQPAATQTATTQTSSTPSANQRPTAPAVERTLADARVPDSRTPGSSTRPNARPVDDGRPEPPAGETPPRETPPRGTTARDTRTSVPATTTPATPAPATPAPSAAPPPPAPPRDETARDTPRPQTPREESQPARQPLDPGSIDAFQSQSRFGSSAAYADADSPSAAAAVARISYILEAYGDAIAERDLDALREVRSPITPAEAGLVKEGRTTVRFSNIDVDLNGTDAIARCRRTIVTDGKTRASGPVEVRLVRRRTGWIITDIR